MDSQALQARSIELAERAYRQKDRASNEYIKEALGATAAELLKVDDHERFFKAQSALEKHSLWTEEQRALSHEMNVGDLTIRSVQALDIELAVLFLKEWAATYAKSNNEDAKQAGREISSALEKILAQESLKVKQQAFNYLVSFIEAILEHTANDKTSASISTIVLMRNLRDSLLSARELLYDDKELLGKNQAPNSQIVRLKLAREAVQEIIATIKPVAVPNN